MPGPGSIAVNVLLVEDDLDNREIMGEVLALAGHAVHAVANGREALRALEERAVDVMVTDLSLPGMNGLDLARAAKAAAPSVAVLLVTGWTEPGDVERARGREVDEILLKPVNPEALTAAVRAVAGRRRLP